MQRRTGGSRGAWTTRYTGTTRQYQDRGVSNTLYNYQVRAFDAAGNYSNFSTITSWQTEDRIICFVEGTLITLFDESKPWR